MEQMIVDSVEKLEELMKRVRNAQEEFAEYSQEQVDKIFKAAATAACAARLPLAKMAVEETGMGCVEDKVIKNSFASEYIYNAYKDAKTCGVIEEDKAAGIQKVAESIGLVAAVIPTTNPTSTSIFKTLICLKTRNGIIISPHPRAKKSTIEAARIVLEAAVKAGAPEGIIGWIDVPSLDMTNLLMRSADIILATGGPGMVKAAYSSGKPALGVGAGNTPAIIDSSADIVLAVNSIIHSKTFDNGMICASEQSVIVLKDIYDKVKKEFAYRGAYFLNPAEYNLLQEKKLSPVLAMYKAKNIEDAFSKAERLIADGGYGHTSSIYIDLNTRQDVFDEFKERMKTCRIVVNTPSSHGGIGDLYNFKLLPSLTLGCGTWGGNSVSENVGIKHLLNIKTVAIRRENMLWFRVPEKVYIKKGCTAPALEELKTDLNKKRAFIVTDSFLFKSGMCKPVTDKLDSLGIVHTTFSDVEPNPTLKSAKAGAELMKSFEPDVIIAIGGGSAMDAGKIMWLLYEHPEADFADMAMRFVDIRKRIYKFPHMGDKAYFVAIPTSAGTGSEVTPFAVITDESNGIKYPLADYELLPKMAIVDADFQMTAPKGLTSASGIDAVSHALEAYASMMATDYTDGLALQALKVIFEYLPIAYEDGTNVAAREKMANAATLAGMAFANAFLGVCHSMAHKLGAYHHIAHGVANALMLEEVIRFNSKEAPHKMGTFPQYDHPKTLRRYAEIAEYLGLEVKETVGKGGKKSTKKADAENNADYAKVEALIAAINDLKEKIGIKKTIKDYVPDEAEFLKTLDEMSEMAFDDQCTGANPRYPLISEIKQMFLNAYYGKHEEV